MRLDTDQSRNALTPDGAMGLRGEQGDFHSWNRAHEREMRRVLMSGERSESHTASPQFGIGLEPRSSSFARS